MSLPTHLNVGAQKNIVFGPIKEKFILSTTINDPYEWSKG